MKANLEAEQGLIGSILFDNNVYDRVAHIIRPEHFSIPAHYKIFEAISSRLDKGQSADFRTLRPLFEEDEDLKTVGKGQYLADLVDACIGTFNAEDYARQIKSLYKRRETIRLAEEIKYAADDMGNENFISDAEILITSLVDEQVLTESTADQVGIDSINWINDLATGNIVPQKTGYKDLDHKMGGFFPGRLYIIAARPGMGKTALGLSIADNIAEKTPCMFLSLEMTKRELGMRLIAARSGVSMTMQQNPKLMGKDQFEKLYSAGKNLPKNLTIIDTGLGMGGIKSIARRHKRKHGEFVLFIDYLGLIQMDRKITNRVHQIEDITTNLKLLSKELNIPVVLLSQLSRGVESRDDKRPNLADLRDSGAIEQDADAVLLIYRPEVYLEREQPERKTSEGMDKFHQRLAEWQTTLDESRGQAEIIIAKNRQGTCGTCVLRFDGERQRFE